MGFVGGDGDIVIPTALPLSLFEHCIVNILWLQFLDVETNPGLRRPVPAVCRILCSNVRGLARNLSTCSWLRLSMMYCFALRLWSQICVTCRSCWFLVSVTLFCCVGARYLRPMGWLHTFEMITELFANSNLSVVVVKCWFLGFVV